MSAKNIALLCFLVVVIACGGGAVSANRGNHVFTFIWMAVAIVMALIGGIYLGIARR